MPGVSKIVSAFTDEQAARLAKISLNQLRYWDSTNFFKPSYGYENRRSAFSRIYSFDDVVGLKVLGQLRNVYEVPLQHLRRVRDRLASDQSLWADEVVFVKDKQIYFNNEVGTFRNAETGEDTLPSIPIRAVLNDIAESALRMKIRPSELTGKISKRKHIARNTEVFEGTRIPIDIVKEYLEEGYSYDEIITEYPALTRGDIEAAVRYLGIRAA